MYRTTRGYNVLAPERIQLHKEQKRTEGLCLTLAPERPGETPQTFAGVRVRLAFPLSDRAHLIAFCDKDGDEIGLLKEDERLDPQSREVLKKELGLVYFVPRVTKIHAIKDELGFTSWDVETDRGRRQFQVLSRYDIRILDGRRLVIRDMDGNRYEIPDYGMLDRASRDMLELEI